MSTGNVTVVTGAAGALGSALTRHLAKSGHRVVALDRKEMEGPLRVLEKELASSVLSLVTDVALESDWNATLAHAAAKFSAPTGAVLTAGGWSGGSPIHASQGDAVWDSMLQSNLETVYRGLRALLPGMVAQGRGSIVVIGARGAVRPEASAGAAAYAASKAAVVSLAQTVAEEVRTSGVRVNAVLPSIIDTPGNRAGMPDADPSKWVSTESLAGVIAFLLSDLARDISGALLPVYGQS
ncbi:SDR family NAD(P)-dependent oxidoreductase [Pendulispora albinea]|uniref:SDR family NAD(P)-dependent oxidoreductase n=1 Tax=Pendulispora albinea TaxID=2741071 RepID=A0ABZ2M0T6_9BACT